MTHRQTWPVSSSALSASTTSSHPSFSARLDISSAPFVVPSSPAAQHVGDLLVSTYYLMYVLNFDFTWNPSIGNHSPHNEYTYITASLCVARIHAYRFVCIPIYFKGRTNVQIESKYIIQMLFPDPGFNALSNGALGFHASWVLTAENGGWMQDPFPWIVISIILYIIFNSQQNQVHLWKEHKIVV